MRHYALFLVLALAVLAVGALVGRNVADLARPTPTLSPGQAAATEAVMQATVDWLAATPWPTVTWIPTATPTYPPTPRRTPDPWATWWAERADKYGRD